MRTYSYSTSAIMSGDDDTIVVNTVAGVLIADKRKDAEDKAVSIAYENYPKSLGYYGHISAIFEFDTILLDKLRFEYSSEGQ